MFKNVNLDHSYLEDKNFKFFKHLGKVGFNLDSEMVEHPGKAFCKFISVQSGNSKKNYYLEFIHIGKGGIEETVPGLSFNYLSNLEGFSKKLSKITAIDFNHKNYDWKINSTDVLPGWNMLNFKRKPIQNVFTWFTEYEPDLRKKKIKKPKVHPNSVYSIHGIKLILTKKSKKQLESILFKKLSSKNKLSDGTFLYIEEGKQDRFVTVILNCKSLKKLKNFLLKYSSSIFEDKESVIISNFSKIQHMWNLTIIEN